MLHDGHELDAVVSEPLNSGQDSVGEVVIGGDLALGRRNAHMGLVDLEPRSGREGRALVLPDILLGRVPKDSLVERGDTLVLLDARDPGGNTLDPLRVWEDEGDLDLGVMRDGGGIVLRVVWEEGLKDPVFVLGHRVAVAVPPIYEKMEGRERERERQEDGRGTQEIG